MRLDRYFNSKICLKIMKFFIENPSSIDSPAGISTWINENVAETDSAIKCLVKAKVIVSHGSKTAPAYGLTDDSNIISRIKSRLKKIQGMG